MNKIYHTSLLTTLLFLLTACGSTVVSPLFEIEGYQIEEIAFPRVTRFDGGGVVVYNPEACEQIGEACGFFKLQAFAHLWLRHPNVKPAHYTRFHRNQADCWAATNGRGEETRAAVELLQDESQHEGLLIHGDPAERSLLIKQCAIDAGRWPEQEAV